jgi:MFS family permease
MRKGYHYKLETYAHRLTFMNAVSITYFQAAATAIPTLLIAVAVGIKQGAIYADYYGLLRGRRKIFVLVMLSIVALAIVLGEMAALRAIARGSGNTLEVELSWAAIMTCMLLIVLEMVQPLAEKMAPENGHRLRLSVAGFWFVLAAYSALVIYGVVPL